MVPVSGDEALGFAIALAAACCYDGGYALQALEARSVPSRHALRPSLLGMLLQRSGASLHGADGGPGSDTG